MTDITAALATLSAQESVIVLRPLLVFSIAMVFYSIFVYKYYKFLSKRDIFGLNLKPHKAEHVGKFLSVLSGISVYIVEYVIVLPLFTIVWFGVMVLFIAFLSRTTAVENVLLIAMTVVAATRIAAYYKEELANDMAKLLPFVLLGTFIIDVSYFSFQRSVEVITNIPLHWKNIIYYMLFVVFLENTLRVAELITETWKDRKKQPKELQKLKSGILSNERPLPA